MIDPKDFERFSVHSFACLDEVQASDSCSCYHCGGRFDGSMVVDSRPEPDQDDETPICPKCGVDAVVPFYVEDEVLQKAFRYWFTSNPK